MTRVVLDEGLGLELSNFGRLRKMRPGESDEHRLEQRLGINSWFWQTDYVREDMGNLVRSNALSKEEDLKEKALRTKPHPSNGEIDPPISEEDTRRERAGRRDDASAGAADKHDVPGSVQGGYAVNEAKYEKYDAILAGMGVVWSPEFISSCYPRASRILKANFVKDIRKLSIGLALALYVPFGHESFVR